MKLKGIGHVNLQVSDEARSRWFFHEVLGFDISEEDPEHGGVFMTLGDNFHTLDIGQHPNPEQAQKPIRGQVGLLHIAFQVGTYADLRDAYQTLQQHGIDITAATNHANQRSIYFRDPDNNGMEIYYEVPRALELFPDGRHDDDEVLPITKPGEPLPAWLLEEWPDAELKARLAALT